MSRGVERRAAPRPGLVLAVFAAVPLALSAPSPASQSGTGAFAKALGKDDEEFARRLSRAGYSDLAELLIGAMGASGGSKSPLSGQLLKLDIEYEEARKDPDLNRRIERLEALIGDREEFAQKHSGTPEATQILDGQMQLYSSVGELIVLALQNKDAAAENEKLKARGKQIFEKAGETLEKRLEGLNAPVDGLTPEQQQERYVQRMLVAFGLGRSQYFRSLLFDDGSFERNHFAGKALEVFLDFQLEYPDQLLCYEVYVYEGLSHQAQGSAEKALESFDAAIGLRDTYEKSRSGVYQMAPEAADIVSSAVQQKMLALAAAGDQAGAAAVAADFRASTPDSWTTLKGLAVLALQADAYQALGDQKGLNEVAKTLVEVDPFGEGGRRGRELLGGGGGASTLGAAETLGLAQQSAAREPDHAMELCRRVVVLARGTPDQASLGASAGLLLGALHAQRGQMHESVVAWDEAAERYKDGKDAPECLWRAINGYLQLQGTERRSLYKTLAQERMELLTKRYPQHPYASMAGLIEGQQAEAEGDYVRAAQAFERIAPGAAGHEEGLYRAGSSWSRQARKLFQEKKTQDAREAVKRAEALLVKARAALEDAAKKTLEVSTQERMRAFAFSARIAQANLYLQEGVDRSAEVTALLQGLDQEHARDPARMSMIWDLRFRALRAQGKLDEAIGLLDNQIRLDPSAGWLESGASALAPVLDQRAQELFKLDPKSAEGERLWGKAATYYQLAIRGQLEGRAAIQVEQLEGVADRLLLFGLHLEGVPDTVETFAEWNGKHLASELLERAAQAYEKVLPLTPSHRTVIKLARTLGFLGRFEEAAARYAELFERERLVDRVSNAIDPQVVAAKPELLFAYSEWGVSEREVGVESEDNAKLLRAQRIFEALVLGTTKGSKLWWQAQFHQLQTLVDLGKYEVADVSLKSLQLNWEHFDEGKYGFEPRFVELREQLTKKVFRNVPPQAPIRPPK